MLTPLWEYLDIISNSFYTFIILGIFHKKLEKEMKIFYWSIFVRKADLILWRPAGEDSNNDVLTGMNNR